jgi:hypothetical protein
MLSFFNKLKNKTGDSSDSQLNTGLNKEMLEMQTIPAEKAQQVASRKGSEERLGRYNSPIGVDPKAMAKAAAARIDAIEQEIALDLRGSAAADIGLHPRANQVASRTGFNRIAPPKGVAVSRNTASTMGSSSFLENNVSFTVMPESSNTLILGDTNFSEVIEVKEVTMAPAVEEAAILYANGQLDEAINLLLVAFREKDSLGNSEFNAYRVLFDLLRYKGDSKTFDRYAIDFATRFEKSPPAWELPKQVLQIPLDNIPTLNLGEILDSSIVPVLEQLKVIALHSKRMRIDVGNVTNVNYTDGFGCELLMRVLNAFENTEYQLELVGTQHLFQKLRPFIQSKQSGVSGHLWLLYLEMLRMQNQQLLFNDISLKFSQQYEVSPPSWRPPAKQFVDPASEDVDAQQTIMTIERPDNIKLSGEIRANGVRTDGNALINELAKGLHESPNVVCDCRDLRLIEFEVAGRLLTALTAWSAELKTVEFKNLSNPIATLFVVLGIQHLAVVERRRDA